MKWKELLKFFEKEFSENGCSGENIQRDLLIYRNISDACLCEYVKCKLDSYGGFCVCEVLINLPDYVDEDKDI